MRPGYTGKRLEMVYRRRIYAARSYPCGYVSKDGTCGDRLLSTSGEFVEVLNFRHFARYMSFAPTGKQGRKKQIMDGIEVSVVLHVV